MDNEMREFLENIQTEILRFVQETEKRLREYIDERTHDAETRIVRAFGSYQNASSIRFRKLESDLSNVNSSTTQQMDEFQNKLLELETRLIALERPN